MIERKSIISQVTMTCIEDELLSAGHSLRVKRDKRNRIRSISVYGYPPLTPSGARRKEPKLAIVREYVWRPNAV